MLETQQKPATEKAPTPQELIESKAASASKDDEALVRRLTQPNQEWEVISIVMTPATAALILRDHNGSNREFKPKAKEYGRVMARGQWQRNKESLAFDVTGKLRDGQNRLLGCVIADVEIKISVTLGESVEAARFYDAGQPRSAGDILHMGGTPDAALRDRVVKMAVNYEQRRTTGKSRSLDRHEVVEHAERHAATLATAIGLARRSLEKPEGQSPSFEPCLKEAEAATIAFLALNGAWTSPQVGSFLSALQLGIGEGENHPIEQAASKLIDDRRKKAAKTMLPRQRLSLVAQAMQLSATNKRRRLTVPSAKQLTTFERPDDVPDDLLGDGMPLATGSERGDH